MPASWQEAFYQISDRPYMTSESLLRYFEPLYDFLEEQNEAAGNCVGWGGE